MKLMHIKHMILLKSVLHKQMRLNAFYHFYKNFNNKLNELIENKSNIELLVPSNVYELLIKI